MARWKNFRSRVSGYGRRFRGGLRNRSSRGISTNFSMEFLLGGVLGMTDYDEMIPAEIRLGVACMPLRGGIAGKAKAFAQGMVLGNIVQHRFGIGLGGAKGSTTGTGSVL